MIALAMCAPCAGNQNYLHAIAVQFEVVTATLEQAEIPVQGLFLHADVGFNSKNFRAYCNFFKANIGNGSYGRARFF